eukprot:gnl/MRDRNA2_/MRDRNA2_195740_c0_seq1.p1 gnl/MRDRNA2_/MRDRNA2_195740_c0~~gnl/MRDRNA2_/MRDRNA2_195740_c0_seq1.p1  ORF type:complete len:371 (-),score=85.43 gnl/MRDRNA2_/MRDRNA2_195740_c0_seq1:17-1129(-)
MVSPLEESAQKYNESVLQSSENKRIEALQRIERAKAYQADNDMDGAQAEVTNAWYALDEALAICPENHRARFLLVSCSMNAEDFQRAKSEALTIYNDLSKEQLLQMQDSVLHLSIAHAAKMCNEIEDAICFATEATELYPEDPQPYMVLGECLHELNRMSEAEQKCRESLAYNEAPDCKHPLNPQNMYFTLCCLAACLVSQSNLIEAEAYARKAIQVDQASPTAWQHLLDIYKAQGNVTEALKVAQHLVDLDPADSEAASALSKLKTKDARDMNSQRQVHQAVGSNNVIDSSGRAEGNSLAAPRRQPDGHANQNISQPALLVGVEDDGLAPGHYRQGACRDDREEAYEKEKDCMDGWSGLFAHGACCVFD